MQLTEDPFNEIRDCLPKSRAVCIAEKYGTFFKMNSL